MPDVAWFAWRSLHTAARWHKRLLLKSAPASSSNPLLACGRLGLTCVCMRHERMRPHRPSNARGGGMEPNNVYKSVRLHDALHGSSKSLKPLFVCSLWCGGS